MIDMTVDKSVREQAFCMYCMDIPGTISAKTLGVHVDTIYKMEKRYLWKEKRDAIRNLSKDNTMLTRAERQNNLIDLIQGLFAQNVKENRNDAMKKVTAQNVLEAIKLQRLMDNLSTENVAVSTNETTQKIDELYAKYKDKLKGKPELASTDE